MAACVYVYVNTVRFCKYQTNPSYEVSQSLPLNEPDQILQKIKTRKEKKN